ncbi:MAG: hypothetical protein IJK15_07160 [Bacteroidaceae bacterium]|nr:hypothetical protein [Bacteroidaceae bacterium]
MKTIFVSMLTLLSTFAASAESCMDSLTQRLRLFGERIPQEKVYVHMDNTSYYLGDTIWFAAYTRRTNGDRPSKISRVLYAELWNHDGYLVERKLIEMQDGRGHGFFALPDSLYSGYFELRAYTRWQLNWGQTEHAHRWTRELSFYNKGMAKDYYRDYDKLYSRVFPVYDKPKEAGDFYKDMTLRPLRRYFKDAPSQPQLRLSLFPEGGNLVAGVPCRVAFEVATNEGEVREGSLAIRVKNENQKIENNQGETVDFVTSENRGRGTFTFTPEAGQNYEVVFTASNDGAQVRQEIKTVVAEGVALQLHQHSGEWQAEIYVCGKTQEKQLGVTVMREGVLEHFETLGNADTQSSNSFVFQLPTTSPGVHQLTVFDADGRVYADRLFFVTSTDMMTPTLAINGVKDQYKPFEKVALTIAKTKTSSANASHSASYFSLAVRDAAHTDVTFDSGNIMTEMLLASEIKGFVPQAEWFFEKDDEEHRRGLDLLMLTQGWRRFNWQDMAVSGAFELTHPAEQTQMVTGTVNRYNTYAEEDEDYAAALESHYLLLDGIGTEKQYDGERTFGLRPSSSVVERSRVDNDGFGNQAIDNRSYNALTHESSEQRERVRESERRFIERGNLRREVRVHAEFFHPDDPKNGIVGDVETRGGAFRMELPRFEGECVFFLAASDTAKWSKNKTFNWVEMEADENDRLKTFPEYYVRLNFPYPRFVKPYTYYQVHNASLREDVLPSALTTDGDHLLEQVIVRASHGGKRRIDLSKPAYVKDAYAVFNEIMDAGLMTHYSNSDDLGTQTASLYIGDMGMNRFYDFKLYFDSLPMRFVSKDEDAMSRFTPPFMPRGDKRRYQRLEYLDKVYVYSDYSPRREGDERYEQGNQPSVEVSLHRYPDWARRVTYRDRRYILPGFAYQEDFYHPDYQRNPPVEGQKDYRRTLYWNPDLQLDDDGRANVTFYNNSQQTSILVEAEGQEADGQLLYNK